MHVYKNAFWKDEDSNIMNRFKKGELRYLCVVWWCVVCCRKWLLHRFVDNCLASSLGSNTSTGSNACDSFVNMEAIDLNMEASLNGPHFDNAPDLINQPSYHELMRKELNVCKRAADKHPCNYNAWSHRLWVLQQCFNCSLQVRVFSPYFTREED